MNSPPFDHDAWLRDHSRMLAVLFERNLGDFLLNALAADLQQAWLRALDKWKQAPGRYDAIQKQWHTALTGFNESLSANQNNPLAAIENLKALHSELEQSLSAMVEETPALDNDDKRLLRFGTRHLVNAVAPQHWPPVNQDVLKTAVASNGMSFVNGLQNFYKDLTNSVIGLEVKTANNDDFIVGETLAVTPGEVVFENELFQLIQYYPCSQQVLPEPLLIVPPWINKFYVLDLNPADSLVQWLVRQGHTLFMISWVNPDASKGDLSLEDYLVHGCIRAVTEVRKITSSEQINLAGYCIGGMLAACGAAFLARDPNQTISSLTLFNSMLDYSEPGELGVFLSKRMMKALADHFENREILDGRIMRQAFTMLREDRMFWPYIVNNYLLGKTPEPNPVLYWNQDATNLPRRMLMEFLADMYGSNALLDKDDYSLGGRKIELGLINIPVYILACRNDHIIPWHSAYNSILPLPGDVCFVLADSGHVMGVINPPTKQQSGYWYSDGTDNGVDADSWLQAAEYRKGSWWPHWHEWLATRQPEQVAARFPGAAGSGIIEPAPGRYVKIVPGY